MKNYWYALLCFIPLFALASGEDISKVNRSINVSTGEVVGDVGTVNGSIRIEAGATAKDIETVNGSITIEDRATVGSIETVNGGIRLGEQAKTSRVSTVNGAVKLGAGAQVAGEASAVNGSISLASGGDIKGKVSNVNGRVSLESAHVGGGIETTNGDIEIGRGSRVEGGILVKEPRSSWFQWNHKRPKVTIGPEAIVQGSLRFEQEVDLFVSDRAKIGPVSGATAITFSGDEPSNREIKAAEQKVEK